MSRLTWFRRAIHLQESDGAGVCAVALVDRHDGVLADGEAVGDVEFRRSAAVERLVHAAEYGVVIHQTYQAGWRGAHSLHAHHNVQSGMLVTVHRIHRSREADLRVAQSERIDTRKSASRLR